MCAVTTFSKAVERTDKVGFLNEEARLDGKFEGIIYRLFARSQVEIVWACGHRHLYKDTALNCAGRHQRRVSS